MYKDLQTSIWGWTKADTDDRSNVKKEVPSAGDRKRTALKPLAEWNFFLFNFDFFYFAPGGVWFRFYSPKNITKNRSDWQGTVDNVLFFLRVMERETLHEKV